MRILVIGTGYVGLVTGACFAKVGHTVTCLDIDEEKIKQLKRGIVPIYEPHLETLVTEGIANNTLSFTLDAHAAITQAEAIFLTVPTPSTDDGMADLSYIESATLSLATYMQSYKLIVIKSTVPPGTASYLAEKLSQLLTEKHVSFDLVSNPEFLREGCAVKDCMQPERVIVGTKTGQTHPILQALYEPFHLSQSQFITMDLTSAEMTKYAANAMLATRISFMNELSGLCDKLGANIEHVRVGIGSDSRIGPHCLYAGVGFGGSCFPKDIRALRAKAKELNYSTPILDAIETVNATQKKLLGEKIRKYFALQGGVKGKTIAIWGLSFKPDTDDIREAPALELIQELRDLGAHLRLFDPAAMNNAKELLQEDATIAWCQDEYEASQGADAVALLTEWRQFRTTNLGHIRSSMQGKALFDGRNQYTSEEMHEHGFDYFGIGIPKAVL